MIKIWITDRMKDLATKWEEETLNTWTVKNTENYNGIDAPRRFYTGYLGEICMWKALEDNKKRYRYHHLSNGKSDDGDFFVWMGGKMWDTDTKTTSSLREDRLWVTDKALIKVPHSIYIAIRLVDDYGIIDGWTWKQDLENDPILKYAQQVKSRKFCDLENIEDFMDMLDEGKRC